MQVRGSSSRYRGLLPGFSLPCYILFSILFLALHLLCPSGLSADESSSSVEIVALPQESKADEGILDDMTKAELDTLKSLKQRHQKLVSWEQSLRDKQNLLNLLDQSVGNKITDLEKMKKDFDILIAQYKKSDTEETESLAKVYENMKPQEAAHIFEGLDINVIASLLTKMQEAKLAAVLEKMKTDKAREITATLLSMRKLPQLDQECYCKK